MVAPLVVVLDRDAGEAAYEQIASQIREAVATGALVPGSPLPGVRTLATDLGVNFNTVARAYRVLEEQGFVIIRDRSGAEVATPAARASRQARAMLERELWEVMARMRQAGFSERDLRKAAESCLDRLKE
ncbi:MAG: GntR family transcriptional regulator [Acidobacteria bacterium]|nr:GntR family transcriptional regulator [Acidobacteriota bacterium]